MNRFASARRAAMMPIWAAQLLTGAKSFMDNPLIGSQALNQRGLHTGRIALAHRLAASRRDRLSGLLSPADRAAFDRDGYLAKPDFLPPDQFAALLQQVQTYRGPARQTVQGNAITRRVALDPATLRRMPALGQMLLLPAWTGPIRYAGSFDTEPVNYIQTILTHSQDGPDDPQCDLHADTFHPTVKAWLFLTDVPEDEGPFTYVAGSHRFTPERRAWERAMSLGMAQQDNRLTRRGSFRVHPGELSSLDLPQPTKLAVPANTLVVADTHGFHARGPSVRPTKRVEIWAYGRRNPFVPWTGLDLWTIHALGRRRSLMFWKFGDTLEAMGVKRNVWRAMPDIGPFDDA
jgi:hypothetical protein